LKRIRKILIANRGEIAGRILEAAWELGIETAIVYTIADQHAPYLEFSNEKYLLKGDSLQETYLNRQLLIDIAIASKADAIHPGYGFLSEDAEFASMVKDNGLYWIGPSPEIVRIMGDKLAARKVAVEAGVPVSEVLEGGPEEILNALNGIKFPLMIKANAGGGGRGMRIVHTREDLKPMAQLASIEAEKFFGSKNIFAEQYIEDAKHIEVQVVGDKHGNYAHLFERECSVQRRYQKIIEEAPSTALSPETREKITQAAIKLVKSVSYDNVGTVEFLMDKEQNFYFIEMNTRIQVEHPVTEMITGIDLVKEQIRIAEGKKLSFEQKDVKINGHSIECRICAEDIENGFIPSPGTISNYIEPSVNNIRIDSAVDDDSIVTPEYDSMLAKMISWGENRTDAIETMISGLDGFVLQGVKTNIELHKAILRNKDFVKNEVYTNIFDQDHSDILDEANRSKTDIRIVAINAAIYSVFRPELVDERGVNIWKRIGNWRGLLRKSYIYQTQQIDIQICSYSENSISIELNNEELNAEIISMNPYSFSFRFDGQVHLSYFSNTENKLIFNSGKHQFELKDELLERTKINSNKQPGNGNGNADCFIRSPLPGKLVKVLVEEGDRIEPGMPLIIVESMKTESQLRSNCSGLVLSLKAQAGQQVKMKEILIEIEPDKS
jgi:3-methylcrotonyl-CoA carboxylase alpha subunit